MNQRGPYGKENVVAARQFLAATQAMYPEIKGRVSPGDMKPAQVTRLANRYYKDQKAGLEPSVQRARGHATTPEHPGRAVKSLPPPHEAAHRAAKARPLPPTAKAYGNGKIRAPARTKKEVRAVIKATPGKTVHSIAIEGKDGRWATAVVDIPVEELQALIDGDYDTWLDYLDELGEGLGESDPGNPTGYAAMVIV
jgi:hypothetical protein